jgi:hypothetical protein
MKASTMMQISTTSKSPRAVWTQGMRDRMTAPTPPRRDASATAKMAKNQKRIITTIQTL